MKVVVASNHDLCSVIKVLNSRLVPSWGLIKLILDSMAKLGCLSLFLMRNKIIKKIISMQKVELRKILAGGSLSHVSCKLFFKLNVVRTVNRGLAFIMFPFITFRPMLCPRNFWS